LKQKVLKKLFSPKPAAKPLWPWFSFIFVAVLLFSPLHSAFADSTCSTGQGANQLCDLNQVTLKTDIKINGQSTNFVKVGQQDGSFQLEVIITLVSPATLTLNSSNINTASDPKYPTTANFKGFGAVVTPSNTSAVCTVKNSSLALAGEGFTYQNCSNSPFDYTQDNNSIKGPVFQAGQTVFDATFTVNSGNFSKLGITQLNNGTDPNSGVNQFYVYPEVEFGNVSPIVTQLFESTFNNTYLNFGLGGYAQLYSGTQAQANQTTTQPVACTSTNPNTPTGCVPGYSSVVGAGTNVGQTPDKLTQFLNQIVAFVLSLFQQLIYGVFAWLILPIILAVLSIHPYQDTFVAVIYSGWETIRNLCDIFFIVALIIIAMATLFRVESYKARHLLVQLIIAALLINFSLVIGQAVLAVADTAQSQFLPSNEAAVQNLGKQLMTTNNTAIVGFLKSQQSNPNASAVNNSFGGFVASVFWLAMSLGSFAVFCAIAVFLVIRIVMLWLLLMISPVAYAVAVLPSTAQYREKWWKEFLKYAFFTPIMAFFLNMTALMATNATVNAQLRITAQNASIFGQEGFANLIVTLGSNVLLLVFLFASLEVAKQAGIFGAETVNKLAKGGIFLPFKAAGMGLKAAGNRSLEAASDISHVELDPRVWKHEIGEYLKKRKNDRKLAREEKTLFGGVPTGSPRDLLENYANGKGIKRVWQSRFGLRGFKGQMKKVTALETKAQLLSDDDRKNLEENLRKKQAELSGKQAALADLKTNLAAQNSKLKDQKDKKEDTTATEAEIVATQAEISRANVEIVNLKGVVSADQNSLDTDKEKRAKAEVGEHWTNEQRDKARAEYEKFRNLAEQVERPQAYYARAARLEREAEEDKKIAKIEDEGELNKLLRNARRQGDKPKAVAILKKLTRDRNLNEALEDEGLSTSYEDVIKYFEGWTDDKGVAHAGFANDLHMNHHEMMQIATEVGYVAEESKQYNAARMTWIDPETGELNWNGYKGHKSDGGVQHTHHVLTEARKSEPRKRAGELSRWSYGDEHLDKNLGRRVFKLNDVGIDMLLDYASPGQERWVREQFNTWSAMAAEADPKFEEKLRKRAKERGLDKPQIDPTKPAGSAPVNYVDAVINNIHLVGKGEYNSKK